jgi:transposase
VSKLYGVSKSSLQRWAKQSPTYRKQRSKHTLKNEIKQCILNQIRINPFTKIEELASIISSKCNLKRSRRTVNRYVKAQGLTYKSAFRMVNAVHPNEKVKQFCKNYITACDEDCLISIDETGFYLGDHKKKGWVAKGKRLAIKSDKNLRRTKFTLILAVSSKGLVGFEILDHNCKKADFLKFVQNLHIPCKSTIIMDNIAFHHSKEIVHALTLKGASFLYSLSYSPKLNPVENVFGMLKPRYREKCPPEFNKLFDYKLLFKNTLIKHLDNQPLDKFFTHVRKIAVQTLADIEANPIGFIFNGYDL